MRKGTWLSCPFASTKQKVKFYLNLSLIWVFLNLAKNIAKLSPSRILGRRLVLWNSLTIMGQCWMLSRRCWRSRRCRSLNFWLNIRQLNQGFLRVSLMWNQSLYWSKIQLIFMLLQSNLLVSSWMIKETRISPLILEPCTPGKKMLFELLWWTTAQSQWNSKHFSGRDISPILNNLPWFKLQLKSVTNRVNG